MSNSRWPKLPPRTSGQPQTGSVQEEIEHAKQAQRESQRKIRDWLKGNTTFDIEPFIDTWVQERTFFKTRFLQLVVEHMSAADSINEVNETLKYGFKMEEAGIDPAEVEQIISKLFRIRATLVLLERANLPTNLHDEIVQRVIARELPNRDGKSSERANGLSGVVVPRSMPPPPEPPARRPPSRSKVQRTFDRSSKP